MVKRITKNEKETQKLARELAEKILNSKKDQPGAFLVALVGDLGAGKTTFVKGFAEALGIREQITSPTFVILKRFKLQASSFRNLIHIDAYRVDNIKELEYLGWKEMVQNSENIILIEWTDNIKDLLKKPYFLVNFGHKSENERTLDIELIK